MANLKNLTKLDLDGNKLSGSIPTRLRIQLAVAESKNRSQPTDSDISKMFSADPLGLIAHADVFREYSLGPELWEVWTCDIPIGDITLAEEKIMSLLKRGTLSDTSNGCPMIATNLISNTPVM